MSNQELTNQEKSKKKRRGKPQDRSKLRRNSQVQIRLTEEEVAELKAAAAQSGMSLADFVMAGIHQTRCVIVPEAGRLRTELLYIGRNLNQALKLAYIARKEGRRIDFESIVRAVMRVEESVDLLCEWIQKWDAKLTTSINKEGA